MTYLSPKIVIMVGGKVVGHVQNINIKVQEEPVVGQVWKHDSLRHYKIKILVVNDRHIEVECVESQLYGGVSGIWPWPLGVGDKHILEEDTLHSYYTKCKSSVKQLIKQLHGESCTKCKRYYPHTPKQTGFICWGCKNGP